MNFCEVQIIVQVLMENKSSHAWTATPQVVGFIGDWISLSTAGDSIHRALPEHWQGGSSRGWSEDQMSPLVAHTHTPNNQFTGGLILTSL